MRRNLDQADLAIVERLSRDARVSNREIAEELGVTEGTVRARVKRMEEEKLSAGGIVIPDSATEKPVKGEVLAVGEGKPLDNGSVRAPKVKVGDKVLFGKYAGTEIKHDGVDILVVKEDDILAILA